MFKLFSKKGQSSVKNLSEDDKIMIEEALSDGDKPTEISKNLGIELQLVYRHYNLLKKREERAKQNQPYRNSEIEELREKIKLEDLKNELESKKLKKALELERLQLEIEEKRLDLYGDEEIEEEELPGVMQFLTTLLNKNQAQGETQQPNINTLSPGETQATLSNEKVLSDEEILQLIKDVEDNNPHYITMAKTMPEAQVKAYLKQNYSFSDDTIRRALAFIKNGKIKQ